MERLDKIIELLEWQKEEMLEGKKRREEFDRKMEEHSRRMQRTFRKESDFNVNQFKTKLIEGLEESGMKELAEAAKKKRLEDEEWKRRIAGGAG